MTFQEGLEHIIRQQEPLAPWTTLRLGGPAEYFAEPTTQEELQTLVTRCLESEIPLRVLGGGSNLLVRDAGVPGVVVSLASPAFQQLHVSGTTLRVGGGVRLAHAIAAAVRDGLGGLELLAGIPGTVGGAVCGNAGTENADIGQHTRQVLVLDQQGEIRQLQGTDLRFSYRKSSLQHVIILEASFELEEEDPAALTKRLQTQWIVAKSAQPRGELSCAMLFKNPGGVRAAELIHQAGMRGTRIGQAEIYKENPNFVIAHPGATAEDVQRLIDLVRQRVHEHLGVELELHLEIW